MAKSERSNYTALDFVGWKDTKALVLTPKFQRRGVWSAGARSFFIDTLLHEMPVPPIFLRVRQSDDRKKIIREVVDGQQRLSTVLAYMNGEFKLSKTTEKQWAGKRFSDLDSVLQNRIRQFSFICEVFHGISDAEILEIFARLNQYSVPLNPQELRNGKYFGLFKQSAYRLAHSYVDFWRKHGIFSDRSVARMQEAELTSELLIAAIDGLQDKKKTIDQFYQDYDETFPEQKRLEHRFSSTMDAIEGAVGEVVDETLFTRPPLFYTLYCAVYHRIHGLPKFSASTPKRALTTTEGHDLADALSRLSEVLAKARAQETYPSQYSKFVAASLQSTDKLPNRSIRLQLLYQQAF